MEDFTKQRVFNTTVALTRERHADLKEMADIMGMSMAEATRAAVDKWMKECESSPEFKRAAGLKYTVESQKLEEKRRKLHAIRQSDNYDAEVASKE